MPIRGSEVFQIVRDKIIYLELVPGSVIHEAQLVEQLHVSRTPVREALIRLGEEMLVQTYPQRGTYVTKIDMDYVRQLMTMRNILETEILIQLSRQRPALREEFAPHMFMLDRAIQNRDIIAYLKADAAFHSQLFRMAGYPLIWERLRRSHSTRYRLLDLLSSNEELHQVYGEHERILACIEQGDAAGLREALTIHHDPGSVRQGELMRRYPDYFGTLDASRVQHID